MKTAAIPGSPTPAKLRIKHFRLFGPGSPHACATDPVAAPRRPALWGSPDYGRSGSGLLLRN